MDQDLARIVGRIAGVRAAADELARAATTDPDMLNRVGNAYAMIGVHDRALEFYRRAANAAPFHAGCFYNLGSVQSFTGDFEASRRSLARAVELDPDLHQAWLSLVLLDRQTREGNHLPRLEGMFNLPAPDPDGNRALHLGHAIAKTYEDLGDPVASFDWLVRAKEGRRRNAEYSPVREQALFTAAAETLKPASGPGFDTEEPVFVLGLPRTGTTLVDRILSAHPDVTSAGELNNFPLLVRHFSGVRGTRLLEPSMFEAIAGADMAELGRRYLESTRPITGAAARFTDKTPINVVFAGLIHRALPNARIVCLRRDPMDSVLSYFRQIFFHPKHPYPSVYDLRNAAIHYAHFHGLADHWRRVLPADRFLELRYETLIADQEGQTRRLVDFVGLPWDPRCLDFHSQPGVVATPSAVQVRQPIYSSSIGRWKRYGDRLAPALDVLKRAGVLADEAA
ncbi:MAG TPA: sulfotransferase [Caulobacteraceae bacterium]|nr:sulfotransferase [Caulobacteraceae bacterium]